MTSLAARLAPLLPTRLVAATARALYPRFEPELARLAELCPPDCGTAVDVGGWYGPWTHRLSGRAEHVVTIEPVPHLARLLAAATPPNVRVIRAAASDRPGLARLWLPSDDSGDRGVSSLVRRDIHGRALDVPCVTLDELGLRDVGFIKIDVDGNEPAVLRGATGLLARDRPALFVELESRIQPIAPVVTYLALLGYDGWVLPGDTWVPLAKFPLEDHQADASYVVSHGLLRRVLPSPLPLRGPRYVNSVLFLPDGRRPGKARWATMVPMPSGKRPASPFTPLDFQLVLLRRMADHNPGLVEDARHELGVSLADMREANKRWQAMLRSPRSRPPLSRYRSVLGAAESRTARRIGDLDCEAWLWPVPLWPALRFEVLTAPNGAVWNEWLVRAPGAEGPELHTLDDLTPGPARSTRRPEPSPRPAPWRARLRPGGGWRSRRRTRRVCGGRPSRSSRGGCCSGWPSPAVRAEGLRPRGGASRGHAPPREDRGGQIGERAEEHAGADAGAVVAGRGEQAAAECHAGGAADLAGGVEQGGGGPEYASAAAPITVAVEPVRAKDVPNPAAIIGSTSSA
ncbi:hypothetical protein GCM10011428_84130 [Streptomyces violaceus]